MGNGSNAGMHCKYPYHLDCIHCHAQGVQLGKAGNVQPGGRRIVKYTLVPRDISYMRAIARPALCSPPQPPDDEDQSLCVALCNRGNKQIWAYAIELGITEQIRDGRGLD
jgi:hypothetical protein